MKPENIIAATSGDYWLIDFGIARHLTLASLTATSSVFGKLTLGYAPNEQMRNRKVEIDARSDLFALGVTLLEAGSGKHPFRDPPVSSALEVIKRVEELIVVPDFGTSSKAQAFAGFVETLIQKRRVLRPRCAAEALEWLHEIV